MNYRANPAFLDELKEYGDVNIEACFNCGNCTAICPLSTDETPFPRNNIRLMQLGLKDRILQNVDPWLCYYCGDCSETCPRGAEPAEAQMALRRWLTAQYDWTGLGRLFYTSKAWVMGVVFLIVTLVTLLLVALLHGPVITDRVELNTFAPIEIIHTGDLILAALLSFFLLTNVLRMYLLIFHRGNKVRVPIWLFITEAWSFVFHFFTQQRFSKCESKARWVSHLILVSGYGTMFVLIVVFISWFQTDNIYPIYHPQRWIGYLAAIALIYGAGDAIWGRIKKKNEMHRFSQLSDWVFPVLLLLLSVSGMVIHFFRYQGWALATYYSYVAHLIIMLNLYFYLGPMGKWSHMLYRPIAIYFHQVKQKAVEQQLTPSLAPVGAD
jgi:ferredoxin